tara:strand:- start:269 stop:787 length:519 start_codon:yes stop_codon:yes gene_type:complete
MNVILSPTALIQIFVFGSNLAGIHGLGSAREAVLHHGAEYIKNVTARFGVIGKNGFGLQGNSFAIPTKDQFIRTMPLFRIKPYVKRFIMFAEAHPEMQFNVVNIGCRNAGYTPKQIAPMFAKCLELRHSKESDIYRPLSNVKLSDDFISVLTTPEERHTYQSLYYDDNREVC